MRALQRGEEQPLGEVVQTRKQPRHLPQLPTILTRLPDEEAWVELLSVSEHEELHSALGYLSPMQFEATLAGGAAPICRLMIGLCTPILRGNLTG